MRIYYFSDNPGFFEKLREIPYLSRLLGRGVNLGIIPGSESLDNGYHLYHGRGISGPLHIGHTMGLEIIRSADSVGIDTLFQISLDEKSYTNQIIYDERQLSYLRRFSPGTKIIETEISNISKINRIQEILREIDLRDLKRLYGEINLGQANTYLIQAMNCYIIDNPCVVVCGMDQIAIFNILTLFAKRLNYQYPTLLITPNIKVRGQKISSSMSPLLSYPMSSEKIIAGVNLMITGGGDTLSSHRQFGADLEKCEVYTCYRIFETDEDEFSRVREAYRRGEITSTEIKKITVDTILSHYQRMSY